MTPRLRLGFVGGGNMARALIGGILARDASRAEVLVIETADQVRATLAEQFPVRTQASPDAGLAQCDAIIVAVKPQHMREAALAIAPYLGQALIVSVAAGIRSGDLARWIGFACPIVRCMPNTPALIGRGMTGLFASSEVTGPQRALAETLLGAVGQTLWVDSEDQLDVVTAISGSGPAYVFYFIEALERAALELGLGPGAARQLALATFEGATSLALSSTEPPALLRERVTSKGGTTHAAITSLGQDGVADAIVRAIFAAAARSVEMGEEFGRN